MNRPGSNICPHVCLGNEQNDPPMQTWWLPRLSNGYGGNLVVTMTTLCCLSDYSYCMVCMFIYQYTFVKLFMFVHGLFMFVHGLCTTMS